MLIEEQLINYLKRKEKKKNNTKITKSIYLMAKERKKNLQQQKKIKIQEKLNRNLNKKIL